MIIWRTLTFILGLAMTGAGMAGMYLYGAALWNADALGAPSLALVIGAIGIPFLAGACTLLIAGAVFLCTAMLLEAHAIQRTATESIVSTLRALESPTRE